MRRLSALLLVAVVAGCGSEPPPETRFIHATVPSLVEDFGAPAPQPTGAAASLTALLHTAGQLPGTNDVPDFLVIAGVSRNGAPQGSRDSTVARAVQTLGLSPVRHIIVIPVGAVRRDTSVWPAIVSRSAAAGIAITDLTSCYEADTLRDSRCTLDLVGTDLRVIGFPSLTTTADTVTTRRVAKWVGRLDTLVTHAGLAGRSVIIVTDVPDPALWESAGIPAEAKTRFNTITRTRAAAFVGLRRSTQQPRPHGRVIETPVLSSNMPADSVLGFMLVRASDGSAEAELFRLRAGQFVFTASPRQLADERSGPSSVQRFIRWLKRLTQSPEKLGFYTIIAIATLLAFLTIIQLWEVPPPGASLSGGTSAGAAATGTGQGTATSTNGLFKTNMGRAVAAGIAGLGAVAFLDEYLKTTGFNAKAFYVVAWVSVFFIVLFLSAVVRGAGEALRHSIVTLPPQPVGKSGLAWNRLVWLGVQRVVKRLGATLLVWYDTSLAVIQGKNQFASTVWTKTILEHHRAILSAAETIRAGIEGRIRAALIGQHLGTRDIRVNISLENETQTALYYVKWTPGSLQSKFTTKSVAYLAVASGQPFWWKDGYSMDDVVLIENDEKSASYRKELPNGDLRLSDYFEYRPLRDYDAFLVIPFPLRSRTIGQNRRGGIHFSFANKAHADAIIDQLEVGGEPNYGCCHHLFETNPQGPAKCETRKAKPDCAGLVHFKHENIALAVEQGVEVLQFLFAAFDDDVYEEYRGQI